MDAQPDRPYVISRVRRGLSGPVLIEGVIYPTQRFTVSSPYEVTTHEQMLATVDHVLAARGTLAKPLR